MTGFVQKAPILNLTVDEVADDEPLLRRIRSDQFKPTGRPSSAVFKTDNMSVDRERMLETPLHSLAKHPEMGLCRIASTKIPGTRDSKLSATQNSRTLPMRSCSARNAKGSPNTWPEPSTFCGHRTGVLSRFPRLRH